MSRTDWAVEPRISAYITRHSLRDDALLSRLRDETATLPRANMQISAEQGQFLTLLIGATGVRRAIEVGTFTGYSSLCIARALPADGRLVACDVSAEWTAVARRYWAQAGVMDRIDLRLAPALETLDALLSDEGEGTYDFAFIDADKRSYDRYYERCLRLLRRGGLMAIDNVLWDGKVIDDEANDEDTMAIRAFNVKVHRDPRVLVSMLPIADGLTLAMKQ